MSRIVFFLFLCFIPNFLYAEGVADGYIKKAKELKLYKEKEWLALLHYKNTLLDGYRSIIETDNFFLSKNGKKSPEDELNATIAGFFDKNTVETEDRQHPICQFPARFEYLDSKLHFDKKALPKVDCKRFKEFYDEVEPAGLTIIFPTSYINNPASMFGHTLIRIDRKNRLDGNIDLNSFVVNYGADTKGEKSGIIYAYRGVFGKYNGFFSVMPYYKMTNDYNNLENRDIWEYKLNYTQKEAEFYTKHIWELVFSDSKYYFFQKNCSYLILESLNVLRPDTDLTKGYVLYTAPVDTLRTLQKQNIIVSKKYRPSLQKQIENSAELLNSNEKKFVKKYVKSKEEIKLESENQDLVYETAYNLLKYKKVKGEIDEKFYRKQSIKILSKVNDAKTVEREIEEPISPDMGHRIGKVGLSFGRFNERNYIQLNFKPVYHELIDDSVGFDNQSEISFLNTSLRYYLDNDRVELDKIDFIKIKSFASQTYFFKPMSFSVLFGVNNLYDDYKILLLDLNGGFTFGNRFISVYGLLGPKINYSGRITDNFNIGLNVVAGTLLDFKYLKLYFDFKVNKLLHEKYNYNQISLDSNIIITKNFYLNLKFDRYFYRKFKDKNDLSAGIRVMF